MIMYIIFVIMSCVSLQNNASPGCLDNSWHMRRPFDTKDYHVVTRKYGRGETFCPCPCRRLTFNRGQCIECGHRHEMPEWHIIRTTPAQCSVVSVGKSR